MLHEILWWSFIKCQYLCKYIAVHFFSLHWGITYSVHRNVLLYSFKTTCRIELWLVAFERYGSLVNIFSEIVSEDWFSKLLSVKKESTHKHQKDIVSFEMAMFEFNTFLVTQIIKMTEPSSEKIHFRTFLIKGFQTRCCL